MLWTNLKKVCDCISCCALLLCEEEPDAKQHMEEW